MIMQLTIDLGQKQMQDAQGNIVEYSGEILDGDKPTGIGEFTYQGDIKFTGHVINGMKDGAGTSP